MCTETLAYQNIYGVLYFENTHFNIFEMLAVTLMVGFVCHQKNLKKFFWLGFSVQGLRFQEKQGKDLEFRMIFIKWLYLFQRN